MTRRSIHSYYTIITIAIFILTLFVLNSDKVKKIVESPWRCLRAGDVLEFDEEERYTIQTRFTTDKRK